MIWKICLIVGVFTYIYLELCSYDIEREFIRRYNRKPNLCRSIPRGIGTIVKCFIPIYNILLLIVLFTQYDLIEEATIAEVLNREEFYK